MASSTPFANALRASVEGDGEAGLPGVVADAVLQGGVPEHVAPTSPATASPAAASSTHLAHLARDRIARGGFVERTPPDPAADQASGGRKVVHRQS